MRFLFHFVALATLCLGLALPSAASAQTPTGPYAAGYKCGALDLSQGTTPTVLTSASLKDCTSTADNAAALGASLKFSECTVSNTHASQVLYLTVGSVGAGAATTNRIAIRPGVTLTLPLYGLYSTSLSLDANGNHTSGQIFCFLVAR